jgi:hypothetical protein
MFICVYSVFVLSCLGRGLAKGWFPVRGVLPTVLGLRNWSETKRLTDALCSKAEAIGERERERDGMILYLWRIWGSHRSGDEALIAISFILISYLTLKMEAKLFSETSVKFQQTTRCSFLEDITSLTLASIIEMGSFCAQFVSRSGHRLISMRFFVVYFSHSR